MKITSLIIDNNQYEIADKTLDNVTATQNDVGKVLKVKTVTNNKVSNWKLDEAIITDTRLIDAGFAADAKVTGDAIRELKAENNQTVYYIPGDQVEIGGYAVSDDDLYKIENVVWKQGYFDSTGFKESTEWIYAGPLPQGFFWHNLNGNNSISVIKYDEFQGSINVHTVQENNTNEWGFADHRFYMNSPSDECYLLQRKSLDGVSITPQQNDIIIYSPLHILFDISRLKTIIDDNSTTTYQTWSSDKLNSIKEKVDNHDTVIELAKNLIDESKLLLANGWATNGTEYYGPLRELSNIFGVQQEYPINNFNWKENTQYTLSVSARDDTGTGTNTASAGLTFSFVYTDGTTSDLTWTGFKSSLYLDKIMTSDANKTIKKLNITRRNYPDHIIYIKNMMLVEGTTAVPYEPYEFTAIDKKAREQITELQNIVTALLTNQ